MTGAREALPFPDRETLADLATFAGRARRVDPDGACRLVAHADVLAAYVSPVHGGGGPVVLGLRAQRLAADNDLDAVVPLTALSDALARAGEARSDTLAVPTAEALGVPWAGTSPPRRGWVAIGAVDVATLAGRAADGIAEIAGGSPPGAGAAAVAALRARVWGRPLSEGLPEPAGLPAGVAFAAEALGFLDGGQVTVSVYRSGPWWRVTTARGHVLARRPALA